MASVGFVAASSELNVRTDLTTDCLYTRNILVVGNKKTSILWHKPVDVD